MGRAVASMAATLALLAGASAAQAQMPISIDDARVVEQSAGPWSQQTMVRLAGPAPGTITVDWTTVPGSATTVGSDFVAAGGTVTFLPGEQQKPVSVMINGDTVDEWSPTLQQDEVFFIQLSNPSATATLSKARATITLLDDDRPAPGLQFLSATSAGDATSGANTLQWRVPAAPVPPADIRIRWNTGAACTPPANVTDALTGAGSGEGFYVADFAYSMGAAGTAASWPHGSLLRGVPYCYSLFAYYGGSPSGERASITTTPFDATAGPVKWRYTAGATILVPPTVGSDAIYAVDTSGVVHAMSRGDSGGSWPGTWNPVAVGAPAQARSPAVPTPEGSRLFVGTDGGGVHALDARDGRIIWSRSAAFSSALPSSGGVQPPPAGLFKTFGGNNDMLLVGTYGSANAFFALDPQTGIDITSYPTAPSWDVLGMAVVDYAANRVYFTTFNNVNTLLALDLGPPGAPSLTLSALPPNPTSLGFGTAVAPVLRNNRVYVGAGSTIFARDLTTLTLTSRPTGDGLVKGFIWPDRRNGNLYFAGNTLVQGIRDLGASFSPLFQVPIASPSIVLQRPGTDELYVGDGNGRLVRIDAVTGAETASVVLEPGSQIGAPSLDDANNLIVVGSSTGVIYAVSLSVAW